MKLFDIIPWSDLLQIGKFALLFFGIWLLRKLGKHFLPMIKLGNFRPWK